MRLLELTRVAVGVTPGGHWLEGKGSFQRTCPLLAQKKDEAGLAGVEGHERILILAGEY